MKAYVFTKYAYNLISSIVGRCVYLVYTQIRTCKIVFLIVTLAIRAKQEGIYYVVLYLWRTFKTYKTTNAVEGS